MSRNKLSCNKWIEKKYITQGRFDFVPRESGRLVEFKKSRELGARKKSTLAPHVRGDEKSQRT